MPDGPVGEYLRDPGAFLHELLDRAGELAIMWAPVLTPILLILPAGFLGVRQWWHCRNHARLAHGSRLVTALVPPQVDPTGGQVLWSNLHGLLRPAWPWLPGTRPHLGFNYVWDGPSLRIQVWVPGPVPPGLVERAIEAAWPGTRTTTHPATPTTPPAATILATGGSLRLARPDVLPLRTDHPVDPLRALLGAAAALGDSQHAQVQTLARPVTGHRLARARRAATRLHTSTPIRPWSRVWDVITPGPSRRAGRRPSAMSVDPDRTVQARAVAEKLGHPLWEVLIRYAVIAPTPATRADRARLHKQLRGRAHAIAAAFSAHAGRNYLRRRRLRHPATAIARRRFPPRSADLLSIPELAALAHLPHETTVPGLATAGARAVAPAPTVPTHGHDIKPLGVTDTGTGRPVGLTVADARHHLHVIGATGTGKSTLLARMILADITATRAVVVIDPKGDLVTDLLARLPAGAEQRLVLIDPDARTHPVLNVLDGAGNPATAADTLAGIYSRIFHGYWGPRTDDIFRSAVLTLIHAAPNLPEPPTLADLPRLLTDRLWCHQILRGVTDPVLTGFWAGYHNTTDTTRATTIAPLMNKLRAFLLRPFVRHTIAGGPSTLNIPHQLDHAGIVLARLPKGELGEDTTRLLGSFLLARTWHAATARAARPEHARPDAALVVDECHNFLTLPQATQDILAEARAYHLSIVLAHQNRTQLPRELREGIAANARNKIIFTVSPDDAHDLQRHTHPHLNAHDLAHLDRYHAAAHLLTNAQPTPPFTLTTRPLPAPTPGRARHLRNRTPPSPPAAPRPARPGAPQPLDPRTRHTPPPTLHPARPGAARPRDPRTRRTSTTRPVRPASPLAPGGTAAPEPAGDTT